MKVSSWWYRHVLSISGQLPCFPKVLPDITVRGGTPQNSHFSFFLHHYSLCTCIYQQREQTKRLFEETHEGRHSASSPCWQRCVMYPDSLIFKLLQMQDNACHGCKEALTPSPLVLCCQMKATELGNLHESFQNNHQNFEIFSTLSLLLQAYDWKVNSGQLFHGAVPLLWTSKSDKRLRPTVNTSPFCTDVFLWGSKLRQQTLREDFPPWKLSILKCTHRAPKAGWGWGGGSYS